MKIPWSSTINGVFCPSGARSIKQLHIKKVCLLKKMMAERHRKTSSLPWKRNYDTPQVPPPSRSPSKTNIIWVSVRNSSGNMEIDGFLRTNKDFQDLLPEREEDIVPNKIEVRLPQEQEGTDKDLTTNEHKNISKNEEDQSNEETINQSVALEGVDSDFEQICTEKDKEQKAGNTQVSPSHTDVLVEDLAPTVKGLKVSPNEIRCSNLAEQKPDETPKNEVYAEYHQHSRTVNVGKSTEDDNKEHVISDILTIDLRDETDLKRGRMYAKNQRKNISASSNTKSNLSNATNGRQKIGGVQKKVGNDQGSMASGIRRKRSNSKSNRDRNRSDKANVEKNPKNIGKERNTETEEKDAKTTSQGNDNRVSRENSSTKIRKSKSAQNSAKTNRNVQGIYVFAKTFVTSKSKGKTESKEQESKKSCDKSQTKTSLKGTKSATKLPRQSCSVCTVKSSVKDGRSLQVAGRKMRSESDTATCSKVRMALRESQSPVPIVLPSHSQLQNFDKVAKNKLRKALAVQMRKHCYTGTWAFPKAQIPDGELKGM